MEIILASTKHTQINIKNNEIVKLFFDFINELEKSKNNEYSIIFNDTETLYSNITKCYKATKITFEVIIDKPIDLTNYINLKKICLVSNIDLIKFPINLEEIEFENSFNSPIDNLPFNIKNIYFHNNSTFNQQINNLPWSLEKLSLGKSFTHSLDYLPDNLKILKINGHNNYNFANLPIGIEVIIINYCTNNSFSNLPLNLKKLIINTNFISSFFSIRILFPPILYIPKLPNINENKTFYKNFTNVEELYLIDSFEYSEKIISTCDKIIFLLKNKLCKNIKKLFIKYNSDNNLLEKYKECKEIINKCHKVDKVIIDNDKYIMLEFNTLKV